MKRRCTDCGICDRQPMHFPGPYCKLEQDAIESLMNEYGEVWSSEFQLAYVDTQAKRAHFVSILKGNMVSVKLQSSDIVS